MNGVTKESWLGVENEKQRDALLYDMLDGLHGNFTQHMDVCQTRMGKMEADHKDLAKRFDRRKKFDTTAGTVGGFIGGMVSFFASKVFLK